MSEAIGISGQPEALTQRPVPDTRAMRLRRLYPTLADLRAGARRRIPSFAFDTADGGAGADGGLARNAAAFDGIELVPRYGVDRGFAATEVELFGRRYAAPIGIAPMGLPSVIWPGGEAAFARAAQKARVPFCLGTAGGASIEAMAELAPDVLWFQLYRAARNDHAIGRDLVRRAAAAGVHVLMMTLDTPVRTKRTREVRSGVQHPFKPDLRTLASIAMSPAWLAAMARHGVPQFKNFAAYAGPNPTGNAMADTVARELGGTFVWDEVARYRDQWHGPMVMKGILHPADAEKCAALGIEGVLVSNHGGRQVEGLVTSADVLPAIVAAVGNRATVLIDSGVRCGLDVVRAVALGAKACLAGKAFLYSLGALGEDGPRYLIDLFKQEIEEALRQCGLDDVHQAPTIATRHRSAFTF
jgi:L-lactate dehydrogenase (cytochrome)